MVNQAFKFYVQIITASQDKSVTYETLINGLCKVGNIASAVDLINKLPSHVFQDVIMFNSLIHGLCKQGAIEDAVTYYETMIENNILPDLFTLNMVIFGTCNEPRLKKIF
jgi:pentatricopeptide repeat protein